LSSSINFMNFASQLIFKYFSKHKMTYVPVVLLKNSCAGNISLLKSVLPKYLAFGIVVILILP
jgi:hypothetical protein